MSHTAIVSFPPLFAAATKRRNNEWDHSQKKFSTGTIPVGRARERPSQELLGGLQWMDYWKTTTGHQASLTTEVKYGAAASKVFHYVAFQNLGDAGFSGPHTVAQSGGRQVPLLRHQPSGNLRHVGRRTELTWRRVVPSGILQGVVTNSGCHDNCVDKMSWNEQWMGGPSDRKMRHLPTWTMRTGCKARR
jgi:hypothetical protein